MNKPVHIRDDFCSIPPAKVFALSIATFGLYLVYWYEMQYAKSKKIQRSAFKDFLKSYFFVILSFKLSEKINTLLSNRSQKDNCSLRFFFILKFIVIFALEAIFYTLYSIHVFLLSTLILEAAFATMLQTVINEKIPQKHDILYPWQRIKLFHLVVLLGGLSLVLFFQFSDDPFAYFKR
jgi:hypothetical protein